MITKQFNQNIPALFMANRTQVNVGITSSTQTADGVETNGYAYFTVFFDNHQSYTDEALEAIAKKEARSYEVAHIVVSVDGFMLDDDETSQERMNRAYTMLADGATKEWKDANDEWQTIPKETFKNAITASGVAQTKLWVKYA